MDRGVSGVCRVLGSGWGEGGPWRWRSSSLLGHLGVRCGVMLFDVLVNPLKRRPF